MMAWVTLVMVTLTVVLNAYMLHLTYGYKRTMYERLRMAEQRLDALEAHF